MAKQTNWTKKFRKRNNNLHKKSLDGKKVLNLAVKDLDLDLKTILSLPPRHTIYRKINKNEVQISIEEAMVKMRYDEINNNSSNKDTAGRNGKYFDID